MKNFILILILVSSLILTSCGSAPPAISSNQGIASAKSLATAPSSVPGSGDLTRTDDQGMVSFSVTPVNLSSPGNTLDFEVSMNTHSVNLDMDVASLAALTTDKGITVQGTSWDGSSGGHHVSGTLSFPAGVAGKSILDGASTLTLTIKNIATPERMFTWNLNK